MTAATITATAGHGFEGLRSAIVASLEVFSAARRAAIATRSGKKPADADLIALGIAPAQFPRVI